MGQGLYSGIGFGCIIEGAEHWQVNTTGLDTKSLAWEVERRIREELGSEGELDDIHLQMREEAAPNYLIIPLATTERMRAQRGKVEQLPIYCPIPLNDLISSWLAVISPEALAQAQQDWETVRAAAKAMGISLPPGQLIYISDWD